MSKLDWFGHWFYASLFFGMILLHLKDFRGWAFRFVGELGWIGIGLVMGMSSIWAWGFAFLCVDVMGYLKWKKEEEATPVPVSDATEWYWTVVEKEETNVKKKKGKRSTRKASNTKAKSRRTPRRKKKVSKVQRKIRQTSRNTR